MSDLLPIDSASNITETDVSEESGSLEWVKVLVQTTPDGGTRFCLICHPNGPVSSAIGSARRTSVAGTWKFSTSGWTGTVKKHMQKQHGFDSNGRQKSSKNESNSLLTSFLISRASRADVIDAIVQWVVDDHQPFIAVERPSFRKLLDVYKAASSNMVLPGADTIRRATKTSYESTMCRVKALLQRQETRVHLTLDCWTGPYNEAFMAIGAHFIDVADGCFRRVKTLIGFEHMTAGHTALDMFELVQSVSNEFGISHVLGCITADNASANDALAELTRTWIMDLGSPFSGFVHVNCLAHVINLAARDALSVASEPINKLRSYAGHIRSSPQRKALYLKVKHMMSYDGPVLPADVSTRWNSTSCMIREGLKQIQVLENYHAMLKGKDKQGISEIAIHDVDALQSFLELLEDLETVSEMCMCDDILLSTAFLQFSGLVDRVMAMACDSDDAGVREAARYAHLKLAKYFALQDVPAFYISVLLDPRFKNEAFEMYGWARDYCEMGMSFLLAAIKEEHQKHNQINVPGNSEEEVDVHKSTKPSRDMLQVLKKRKLEKQGKVGHRSSQGHPELDEYLSEKTIPTDFDPLDYWKINATRFPLLCKLARVYLAIPCTSVDVERAFSSGRLRQPHTRGSMKPETMKELMLLASWLKLGI